MVSSHFFCRPSQFGQDRILEKVVRVLSEDGFRVGIIKHSDKEFEIDVPGKDSYRMARSGAKALAVSSASRFVFYRNVEREIPLDHLVTMMQDEVDIIITEGYKREDRPKIEVARQGITTELIRPHNLVALVTDFTTEEALGVPVFGFEDIQGISQFIIDHYLRGQGEESQ